MIQKESYKMKTRALVHYAVLLSSLLDLAFRHEEKRESFGSVSDLYQCKTY